MEDLYDDMDCKINLNMTVYGKPNVVIKNINANQSAKTSIKPLEETN